MTGALGAAAFAAMTFLMPPVQYDHEPSVPYTMRHASQFEVDRMCRGELALAMLKTGNYELHALGCTDISTNEILIVRGLSAEDEDVVTRHEKAHVNGWRH